MWAAGQKLILANISQREIDQMSLDWMWTAGEEVTYIRPYVRVFFDDTEQQDGYHKRSFVTITHVVGSDANRTVWVYDRHLLEKDVCIWETT